VPAINRGGPSFSGVSESSCAIGCAAGVLGLLDCLAMSDTKLQLIVTIAAATMNRSATALMRHT
jgi:hypothetical protein